MTRDQLIYTCKAMESYGGGFASKLAGAIMAADATNTARIVMAFPELIEKYGPGTRFYDAAVDM